MVPIGTACIEATRFSLAEPSGARTAGIGRVLDEQPRAMGPAPSDPASRPSTRRVAPGSPGVQPRSAQPVRIARPAPVSTTAPNSHESASAARSEISDKRRLDAIGVDGGDGADGVQHLELVGEPLGRRHVVDEAGNPLAEDAACRAPRRRASESVEEPKTTITSWPQGTITALRA